MNYRFNNTKEYKDEIFKIENQYIISPFNFTIIEKLIDNSCASSNELDQAKFFLKQAKVELTKHNELMQKTANKMKLESFKASNIKGYSL